MNYDIAFCGELVARCFQARTDSHIAHLMTRSFAEHKAMNDFYDGIVGVADTFAEAAQGRWGILKYPRIMPRSASMDHAKPISIPQSLLDWIDENREKCCGSMDADGDNDGYPDMQALIDDICTLCASTIYKLRFLG